MQVANMLGLFDMSATGWIISILLVILVLIVSFVYLHWPDHYFKARGIPGPKPNFMLTDLMYMGKKPTWEYDAECVKTFGKIAGLCVVNRRYLIIADVDMLKEIFVKDFDNFCDRPLLPNRGILKHCVFDVKGDLWKQQRHQLSPYFTTGTLKMSTATINRVLDNLVTLLDKKCDQKEMIEFKDMTNLMTIDAICATAFGIEVDSIGNPEMEFLKKAKKINQDFTTGNIWFLLGFLFPSLGKVFDWFGIESVDTTYFHRFTKQLIEKRKELSKEQYHDFVSILTEERSRTQKGLNDDEMIANAILFLIAGYDTTSSSLAFLMYSMAINPDCQEKVFQEIQVKIGTKKVTYEDLQELTYLDMCIDESSRIYPLGYRLERLCVKDTKVKGIPIEKGTIVAYPVWSMHRDPEVWENPETFDPERFTTERMKTINQFYFSPFGVGPRHCIGMRLAQMEIKMAAVRVLQRFKVVKNSKTQVPLQFSKTSMQFTTEDGIWLSVERRE